MRARISRCYEIECGHRVPAHERCRFLHGHTYRITISCEAESLDAAAGAFNGAPDGDRFAYWLQRHWDHRLLLWANDPYRYTLLDVDPSIVLLPAEPTPEQLARHLRDVVIPQLLEGSAARCKRVMVEEGGARRMAFAV